MPYKYNPFTSEFDKTISDSDQSKLTNLTGTNTGDETTTSIQTKLGVASTTTSGYLTSADWNTFNNKPSSSPVTSVAGKTGVVTLVKADVGLSNVDNTSDAAKSISTDTQVALNTKQNALGFTPVASNTAITGATKTKITYDAKGLVTAGADATTADIADSTDKRYVTNANLTVLNNTSGTNTGDQTTITGNAATATILQTARTINGVSFNGSANITVADNTKLAKAGDAITGNISNTGTGFFQIASGTTAQRPTTPIDGMRRYNTTLLRDEFYANGAWQNHARLAGDTFTGAIFATNLTGTNTGDQTTITGNAGTVTTNANLTGDVSSVGNVTTIDATKFVNKTITNTYTPGMKQVFAGNATNAGIRFAGGLTVNPSALATGDVWFRADELKFRYFDGTIARSFVAEALAQTITNKDLTSVTNTFPVLNQGTTGNAGSATVLQTARTINGVSFNGSANITVVDSTKLAKAGDTITGDIANIATGFFQNPSGTTAQRPTTPLDGMRRYNTTTLRDEFYANGAWQNHIRLNGDTLNGDFSNTGTGFFQVATGTTAQRPTTPVSGMRRHNITTLRDESYANGAWQNHARLSGDTFTGAVTAPSIVSDLVNTRQLRTTLQSFTPTGTTQTIDLSLGAEILINLTSATGNVTLTLSNPAVTARCLIRVIQGTTARNLIFPTGTLQVGGGGVNYVGIASTRDLISTGWNGTEYDISVSRNLS